MLAAAGSPTIASKYPHFSALMPLRHVRCIFRRFHAACMVKVGQMPAFRCIIHTRHTLSVVCPQNEGNRKVENAEAAAVAVAVDDVVV